MSPLDELRQALAEWDRLTKAATPRPWVTKRYGEQTSIGPDERVWLAMTSDSPGHEKGSNAKLIEAAVGLADTVCAILAEAIEDADPSGLARVQFTHPTALRLARAINEVTS